MSPRRFNGWEPTETHVHLDADGIETGRTIVTREPEWDTEQQAWAVGNAEHEDRLCPNCRGHDEKTGDKTVGRVVEHAEVGCEDCRAIEVERKRHHKAKGHTDEKCDCHTFAWWVNEYVPIPAS